MKRIVLWLALLMPTGLSAQAKCVATLANLDGPDLPAEAVETAACPVLAGVLVDSLWGSGLIDSLNVGRQRNVREALHRDLQSTMSETSGAVGSPAQASAIPSVRPVGIASGALAAVGTEGGAGGIASLSVNPFVSFLLAEGAADATSALARYARLLDVSAFFPVTDLDANGDGKLDYFGFRLRLNMTGLSAGDAVWDEANRQFSEMIGAEGLLRGRILAALAVLGEADEIARCAAAIITTEQIPIEQACGVSIDVDIDQSVYGELSRALSAVRDKADSKYWGLDLRADFGDPTLGQVTDASGKSLFLGAAIGGRIGGGDGLSPFGYRARGGLRVASLDQPDTTHVAFEGGAGLELTRTRNNQQMALSAGLEFRYGSDTGRADQFQTNYLLWRAALSIPFTGSSSVTISISRAIDGGSNITPTFSVGADLGLLFPDLGGGG